MSLPPTILSLQGKGLKLDTRADIEPWLKDVDPATIEEIHFGGNTIGVDASSALADFLKAAHKLKVRNPTLIQRTLPAVLISWRRRWQISPTSSLGG